MFIHHPFILLLICVFEISKNIWDVPIYYQIYNLTACFVKLFSNTLEVAASNIALYYYN